MASSQKVPKPLQGSSWAARLIREEIYAPAVYENDWTMFAVVGRENSGKSQTCASILAACDPSFDISHTHFEPVPFLKDIGEDIDTPGRAVMGDEVGVAFGNRTWHDREQIEANQYLQTARDSNRIIGMTVPRLEELDSQLEGRLHILLEAIRKKDGLWVEVKWKQMNPTRDGYNKTYKPHPTRMVNGRKHRIRTVKIGPPPEGYVEEYLPKKAMFKDDLEDRVIGRYEEAEQDAKGGVDPIEIAEEIIANDLVDEYIGESPAGEYLDRDLIELDYGIGENNSKKVKKYIVRELDLDVV